MGPRLAEFHGVVKLNIILLSNFNASVSIANGGQHLHQFLGNKSLSEHLIRIMEMTLLMGKCMTLRNREKNGRRRKKLIESDGTSYNYFGSGISIGGDTLIVT